MILRSIPQAREMIWGSFELNDLFCLDCRKPVGEVWLLSDHPTVRTKVQAPSGESFDLASLINFFDLTLERFPILIKLISSEQWLSVQVHPDDEYAQRIEKEPWGKTECWFFLKDSTIALSSPDLDLAKSISSNSLSEEMKVFNIRAGDLVYVPAGVLHAIGPGSLLIEVQQSSDLTYRVYDWGRGRELHTQKALSVFKKINPDELIFKSLDCFQCDYFQVYRCHDSTYVYPNSMIVMLTEGKIDQIETSRYETYLILGDQIAHLKGEALVIKLGPKWQHLQKKSLV